MSSKPRRAPVPSPRLLGALLLLLASGFVACGEEAPAPAPDRPLYDASGHALGPVRRPERPPNLVLVVLDTLRADAVALPGTDPDAGHMPFLRSLAERGVSFADASAPAPWTLPSMASLFTGLLPHAHGVLDTGRPVHLLGAITTFAEVLERTYGYETAAFVGGPWFGETGGLLQGFSYGVGPDAATLRGGYHLQGTEEMLGPWLEVRDPRRPFFLLLHTFEVHDPYGAENHPWPEPPADRPPEIDVDLESITEPWQVTRHFLLDLPVRQALIRDRGDAAVRQVVRYVHSGYARQPRLQLAAQLRRAYEAGARCADGWLEETVALLEAWGLLENTLLVVTSDHGEAFGEHGILVHGRQHYDELLRVPLVMAGPPPFEGGRVVRGGVGFHDVLPTWFQWAGLSPPRGLHARSALGLLTGEHAGRPVVSEELLNHANTDEAVHAVSVAVRSPRWKYVVTHDVRRGTILEEAYDLREDPGERRDLADDRGRIDPDLGFDAAFCEAVETVRGRLWAGARERQGMRGTHYGSGVGTLTSPRPAPCLPPAGAGD